MAGRGGVSADGNWNGNVPSECKPNGSILRLSAQLSWEVAREPLHADIDVRKACGIGPGLAFANEILSNSDSRIGVIGLVPCAVGGTKIGHWRKGGTVRAILWYQGESDAVKKEDAEAYNDNMERLIMDLRSDLNIPSLLIIQLAVESGEGEFVETVRKAHKQINLANVICADAQGLDLKEDDLHLTTASEVQLGIKLAHAFLSSDAHK